MAGRVPAPRDADALIRVGIARITSQRLMVARVDHHRRRQTPGLELRRSFRGGGTGRGIGYCEFYLLGGMLREPSHVASSRT
jgi:hypothetical protein